MATNLNPAAVAAGSGASPAPAGSGITAEIPASPAGQQGSGAGSPPASPESGNIKQLREQYETTKGKLEPWEKLGKYEEVSQVWQSINSFKSEVVEIGKELGYDDAEILESFQKDPYGTRAFLQQRQAEGKPDGAPDLEKLVDKKLKPVLQREQQRQLDESQFRYEKAFAENMETLFPSKDGQATVTTEEREILHEVATEMFKYDAEAMNALHQGKTSFVARHLDAAKQFLDKYYLARTKREQNGAGGGNPNPEIIDPKKGRPTLDQMISGEHDFGMKS
jgi:hypothetical protein